MPERLKEVHFFDDQFARGLAWYQRQFPSVDAGGKHRIRGEVTPNYLFDPNCADRIAKSLGSPKIIILLRDPVARLESHYRMDWSLGRTDVPIDSFMDPMGHPFRRGLYADQVQRYLDRFDPADILTLVFEELFANEQATQAGFAQVLSHIGSREQHDGTSFFKKVNAEASSGRPRHMRLYRLADRAANALRRHNLPGIVTLGKRLGLNARSFGPPIEPPTRLTPAQRDVLAEAYQPDIARLEALLGRTFDNWCRPMDDQRSSVLASEASS